VLLREEALAHDATEDARKDLAHHHVLAGWKELDEAAACPARVDRVECREDEVARLGSLESRLGGLLVAELADEDHVRVLAQNAPKRLEIRLRIEPHLALVHDA